MPSPSVSIPIARRTGRSTDREKQRERDRPNMCQHNPPPAIAKRAALGDCKVRRRDADYPHPGYDCGLHYAALLSHVPKISDVRRFGCCLQSFKRRKPRRQSGAANLRSVSAQGRIARGKGRSRRRSREAFLQSWVLSPLPAAFRELKTGVARAVVVLPTFAARRCVVRWMKVALLPVAG